MNLFRKKPKVVETENFEAEDSAGRRYTETDASLKNRLINLLSKFYDQKCLMLIKCFTLAYMTFCLLLSIYILHFKLTNTVDRMNLWVKIVIKKNNYE